jgi:hypothetical protein
VPARIRERGNCTTGGDPDVFFDEESPEPALALCASCPARALCLAYALEHEQHGIWGGTTPAERDDLRGGPLPYSLEERRHADLIRSRIDHGWLLEDVADAERVNERTLKRWREHPDQPSAA